ncbi:Putative hydrolase Mb2247c [Rhizoctonia solani]|uniref:Putative hydrolase Mb2247c n=1 Tax=Rhizoctonia solani TaxID=456999 RepID=A0A0K6FQI3_9AGAM|nr:Putative hydrolase Mb2247c [Rhizoctonia solani]
MSNLLNTRGGIGSFKARLASISASSARPVGDVEWHTCVETDNPRVECGNIIVPLDYFDPSVGTATIALAKYKADPELRRGSVFVNPGGPGAPGKLLVTQLGDSLATSKIGGHFDIVAFDPRGIGETTPSVKCFESRESKDQITAVFELGYTQPPNATSDPSAFYDIVGQQRQALALFDTQAKLCAKNMPNGGIEMKYMGTSSVARDIDFMSTVLDGPDAPINYWGQSYGSILGVYLFNMFPDRIGRGMIEGIANPVLWVTQHSHMWMNNWIQDADKAYKWFLDSCVKAGPARCAIAQGHKSPEALANHIEAFIDQQELFNATGLYNALLSPLTWTNFTLQLQSAMEGDPAPLLNRFIPDPSRELFDKAELARYAITCADSPQFNGTNSFPTPQSLARNTLNRIKNISRYFGGSPGTSDIDGGCQFWPVDSVEKFTGPFNKTLANPIVIVSSVVDPYALALTKFGKK